MYYTYCVCIYTYYVLYILCVYIYTHTKRNFSTMFGKRLRKRQQWQQQKGTEELENIN